MAGDIPDINASPLYVPALNDSLQIGSYVFVRNLQFGKPFLSLPKNNATSMARLIRVVEGSSKPVKVEVLLFCRMFHPQGRPPQNHPSLPTHRFPRIVDRPGSENKELYQSSCAMTVPVEDIIQIAFVFSLRELLHGSNRWVHEISNVFFVRYKEVEHEMNAFQTKLIPMDGYVGMPTENPDLEINVSTPFAPRCFVGVAWKVLFMIRQAIMKMLKRNSQQMEHHDVQTCTIGMTPPEAWMYLFIFSRDKVTYEQYTSNDSYLNIDGNFTRKKIKTQQQGTILRFQTQDDLDLLHSLLGFGCTYGCLEKRPTLSDGKQGITMKPGHPECCEWIIRNRGASEKVQAV